MVRDIPAGQLYGYSRRGAVIYPKRAIASTDISCFWIVCKSNCRGRELDFLAARGYDSSSSLTDLSISTVDNGGTTPEMHLHPRPFRLEIGFASKALRSDTVIYETHVRGFTIHPIRVWRILNFRWLDREDTVSPDLGVTAIELMPVLEFNENESNRLNPITGKRLKNYWATIPSASSLRSCPTALQERTVSRSRSFREMVKAFIAPGSK